jgi:hypothetical protein
MPTAPISNLSGALAELVVQFWPTFQPQNVTNTCHIGALDVGGLQKLFCKNSCKNSFQLISDMMLRVMS